MDEYTRKLVERIEAALSGDWPNARYVKLERRQGKEAYVKWHLVEVANARQEILASADREIDSGRVSWIRGPSRVRGVDQALGREWTAVAAAFKPGAEAGAQWLDLKEAQLLDEAEWRKVSEPEMGL